MADSWRGLRHLVEANLLETNLVQANLAQAI